MKSVSDVSRKIVIFIGPPGSGKGSLSELCVQRLNWRQFSTGNLCRKHILDGTDIGKQIDFAIKSGKLISDRLMIDMVRDCFRSEFENASTVILDGFPRTVPQAIALQELLAGSDFGEAVSLTVVRLLVGDEELVQRLSGRLVCQNKSCQSVYSCANGGRLPRTEGVCDECSSSLIRRADDDISAVRERLKIYRQHEQELVNFYDRQGLIKNLDVSQPLEVVYESFLALVSV